MIRCNPTIDIITKTGPVTIPNDPSFFDLHTLYVFTYERGWTSLRSLFFFYIAPALSRFFGGEEV